MKTAQTRPDLPFTSFPSQLSKWHLQFQPADPASIRLTFPSAEKIRMRRLVSRAARRPVYKLFSIKIGRIVQCESQAELELCLILDASPMVLSYGEQPFCLHYLDGGQPKQHIPDFAAQIGDERHVFEVKTEDWSDPEVLARTQLLKDSLAAHGIHYHLIVAGDIPEVFLRNASMLLQRSRLANTYLGSQLLQEKVRIKGRATLAELGWDDHAMEGHSIAREIIEGRLYVDRDQLLSGNSLVRLPTASAKESVK